MLAKVTSLCFLLFTPALAGCNPIPGPLPLHLESLIGVQAEGGELARALTMGRAWAKQGRLPEDQVRVKIYIDKFTGS